MKSTSRITPGPWHVRPPTAQSPSRATVTALSGFVSIYDAPLTAETAANARLIAAAPELATACRLMLPVVKDFRDVLFSSHQIGGVVKEPAEKSELDVLDAMILLAENAVANADTGRRTHGMVHAAEDVIDPRDVPVVALGPDSTDLTAHARRSER